MKIQKFIINYIFIVIFFSQTVFAQNNVKKNCTGHYTESFFINTDRDLFVTGETVLFSVKGKTNYKDSALISKILYLELINLSNNTSVYKGKFEIIKNRVRGNIKIPKNINSGLYAIRIYTQWNKNFNYLNKSDKYISVINPQVPNSSNFISKQNIIKIVAPGNTLLSNISDKAVIFVPEGLRMLNSFQIIKNGVFLKNIQLKNGFYDFKENFSDSSKYSLLRISQSGDSVKYPFPKIKKEGLNINIRKDSNFLKYKVTNINFLRDKNLNLKIYSENNNLLLNKALNIEDTVFDYSINRNILKPGLNFLLLSDTKGKIIYINCLYNRKETKGKVIINTKKDVFDTRELVSAELKYNQNENINVNVSVVLEGTSQFDFDFNPEYIFQDKNLLIEYLNITKNLSDNEIEQILILYESYLNKKKTIRFVENNSVTNQQLIIPDIRGVSLTGYVKDKKTLQPLSNVRVSLSSFKSCPQFHVSYTDKNGKFIFSLNKFYGKNDLFICTENPSKYNIYINNPYEERIFKDSTYTVFFNSNSKQLLKDLYQNAQIHNTFSADKPEISKKVRFNISASFKKYKLSEYIQFKSLTEVFAEIIPEVHLKINKDGTFSFILFDSDGNILPGHPLVLFDYIPVYDLSKIINADFSAIKEIDVLNQPYLLGKNILNGIISIHSDNEDLSSIDLSDAGYFLKYDGIQIHYNEDFLFEYKKNVPDFRNTLFWAPGLLLNENGKKFNFKTSDNTGTYKIVVKGFDADDNYIYSTKYIQVKNSNE